MSHLDLVLWGGLAIGLIFGSCGQLTHFCLQRGLSQFWAGTGTVRLQAFAIALATALLGTHLLAGVGLVDPSKSLYLMPSYSWLLVPLGGLLFGYGMALANGCGARCLVLLGQGNLRSVVVLLCLGISAYVTLTGLLAPVRLFVAELTVLRPDSVGVPEGTVRTAVVLAAVAVLLIFSLRRRDEAPRAKDLTGGVVMGLLIVAGWYVTGTLGADDFEPVPVTSLTFVAPIGDTVQYSMISTGMSLRFGITVVAGAIFGSLVTALVRRQWQLEGFEAPRQLLRYITGGTLMGIGGALALGCSIGQGLTGLSTLSYSSMVAFMAIVAGARVGWMQATRRHSQ